MAFYFSPYFLNHFNSKGKKVESEETKKPAPKKEAKASISNAFSKSKPKKEAKEETTKQVKLPIDYH